MPGEPQCGGGGRFGLLMVSMCKGFISSLGLYCRVVSIGNSHGKFAVRKVG